MGWRGTATKMRRAPRVMALAAMTVAAMTVATMTAAMAVLPATAAADTIGAELGGRTLSLPVPDGYCTFDRAEEYQRELDDRIERVMSQRNVYLGAALDCEELATLEDAPERGFTTYLIWVAVGDGSGGVARYPDASRARFVEAVAAETAPVDSSSATSEATETWQEELDSDAIGIEGLEMDAVGQDDNAYYVATVTKVAGPAGNTEQASLTVGTLVHGMHIQAYLFEPFRGEATFARLEPEGRALAAALVADNPDSDPIGTGVAGFFDRLGITTLRGVVLGAAIGGVIALLVWLVRRARR